MHPLHAAQPGAAPRPRGPAARGVPLRRAYALGVEIAAFGCRNVVVAELPCGGPNASVPRDAAPDAGAPRAQHSLSPPPPPPPSY